MVEIGGKQGWPSSPLRDQVSVSPEGFPSEKNRQGGADQGFVPLFTGKYLLSPGACQAQTHVRLRGCPGWHAGLAVVCRPDRRHAAADSLQGLPVSPHDPPVPAERETAHRASRPCLPR